MSARLPLAFAAFAAACAPADGALHPADGAEAHGDPLRAEPLAGLHPADPVDGGALRPPRAPAFGAPGVAAPVPGGAGPALRPEVARVDLRIEADPREVSALWLDGVDLRRDEGPWTEVVGPVDLSLAALAPGHALALPVPPLPAGAWTGLRVAVGAAEGPDGGLELPWSAGEGLELPWSAGLEAGESYTLTVAATVDGDGALALELRAFGPAAPAAGGRLDAE